MSGYRAATVREPVLLLTKIRRTGLLWSLKCIDKVCESRIVL